LAKADLVSNVVYEFPELQGIIGEYYALAAGEEKLVAQAIREHYLPRFAGDLLPQCNSGIAVSLADKLDSLICFFAIGMQPTGSQDPYALRRAAAGCTQIIIKNNLDISLKEIIEFDYQLLPKDVASASMEECCSNLSDFFRQRVENYLDEEKVTYDIINAVTAKFGDNILDVLRRVEALRTFRQQPGFAPLMAGFTRAANLLRSAKSSQLPADIDDQLLKEEAEKQLYKQLLLVETDVKSAFEQKNYLSVLNHIGELTPFIDGFFTDLMVLTDDLALRNNRVALLKRIIALSASFGDLTKIVI